MTRAMVCLVVPVLAIAALVREGRRAKEVRRLRDELNCIPASQRRAALVRAASQALWSLSEKVAGIDPAKPGSEQTVRHEFRPYFAATPRRVWSPEFRPYVTETPQRVCSLE